jgi:hypothetical protein
MDAVKKAQPHKTEGSAIQLLVIHCQTIQEASYYAHHINYNLEQTE